MNNDELERMLRTQTGPRERGYRAQQLPAEPAGRPASPGSMVLRVAILASAAAAGALVVIIGAAALISGAPGVPGVGGGSSAPTPTAAPTATPAPPYGTEACTAADVDLSAEPWGGAAGSRGTVITLALRDGRRGCTLGQTTGASLTDAAGVALVESEPMSADAIALQLDGEHRYTVGVAWSNWCGAEVTGDITVHLRFLGAGTELEVVPDGSASAVPPCMGDAPTNLSVTGMQPAS